MSKKEMFLVTIKVSEDEVRTMTIEKGQRLFLKSGRYITVGVTPKEDLGPNITVEPAPKKKFGLILKKNK